VNLMNINANINLIFCCEITFLDARVKKMSPLYNFRKSIILSYL